MSTYVRMMAEGLGRRDNGLLMENPQELSESSFHWLILPCDRHERILALTLGD